VRLHGTTLVALVLIAAFLGLQALASYTLRHSRRTSANMRDPRFHAFPDGGMPAWVERKLAPLREAFGVLGFRPLLGYTRESERLNFTLVLVSESGPVTAHLWVARYSGLLRLLTILHSWQAFKNDLLVRPRWALLTEFDGARRYETTTIDLANMNVPGLMEMARVPEELPLAEALARHEDGARGFEVRTRAQTITLTSPEQFFELERAHCRNVADRMEQVLAQAQRGAG
jgi:hypothetical protein